jgi:hypothetical protein
MATRWLEDQRLDEHRPKDHRPKEPVFFVTANNEITCWSDVDLGQGCGAADHDHSNVRDGVIRDRVVPATNSAARTRAAIDRFIVRSLQPSDLAHFSPFRRAHQQRRENETRQAIRLSRPAAALTHRAADHAAAAEDGMRTAPCSPQHVCAENLVCFEVTESRRLPVDVGESRFENITDWLPRAAVELNQSQVFDRPKVPRSSADFDPR